VILVISFSSSIIVVFSLLPRFRSFLSRHRLDLVFEVQHTRFQDDIEDQSSPSIKMKSIIVVAAVFAAAAVAQDLSQVPQCGVSPAILTVAVFDSFSLTDLDLLM